MHHCRLQHRITSYNVCYTKLLRKVFHEAGISWTLSSHASEAANFGMFIGSYENMRKVSLRIREAALDLGVKRIIFGECGHAWRVAYSFLNTLAVV